MQAEQCSTNAHDYVKRTTFLEYLQYISGHSGQAIPALLRLSQLLPSVAVHYITRRQKPFADDFLRVSESYPTNIIIDGQDNIPKDGGLVIVMSHVTSTLTYPCWFDTNAHPLGQIMGLVKALKSVNREKDLRIVGLDDTQSSLHLLYRMIHNCYGSFLVNPRQLNFSLDDAKLALQNNQIIMITPEGRNTLTLSRFHRGVGTFAPVGTPFLPVVYYEERQDDKSCFHLNIGRTIVPPEDAKNWPFLSSNHCYPQYKQLTQRFTDELGFAMAKLLPVDKRGFYQELSP